MGKSNNRSSKPKLSKYEAPKQRRITKEQIENATYKDVKLLEKFLSDRGKIRSSLITGITKQGPFPYFFNKFFSTYFIFVNFF